MGHAGLARQPRLLGNHKPPDGGLENGGNGSWHLVLWYTWLIYS